MSIGLKILSYVHEQYHKYMVYIVGVATIAPTRCNKFSVTTENNLLCS